MVHTFFFADFSFAETTCLSQAKGVTECKQCVCVCVLQVFWTETEAGSAELGPSPLLAASLLHQGECSRGSDRRL